MEPRKPQLGKSAQLLLHGPPGIGKTLLIAQQPRTLIMHPPTDHLDSIQKPGNVEEIILGDHDDFDQAFEYLQQGGGEKFDWVWLDSLSLFQDHGLDEIWKNLIAAHPHRAEWGMDKGEYGRNMERISRRVRELVGLSMSGMFHLGITCHTEMLFDPETEKDMLMPWVQGKNMSTKTMAAMNLVGYYRWARQGKGKGAKRVRVLDFHETDSFKAKDQLNVFGAKGRLVSPTMPEIHRLISTKKAGGSKSKAKPKRRKGATRRKR
jgi:DNA polymerase III delta prime subunit